MIGILLMLAGSMLLPNVTPAAANTWTGGGTSSNASEAANWSADVPTQDDTIVLDGSTHKPMTWDAGGNDLPDTVAAWSQVGYTGTVTILTRYPGQGSFTNFTIAGDCVISNGGWTHTVNPAGNTATYRLHVSIGGNFLLASNTSVSADGLGFRGSYGPGTATAGSHGGASHGGLGASINWGPAPAAVYGSIDNPVTLGSGGTRLDSPLSAGGGAVILTVSGDAVVDGTLSANGAFSGDTSGSGGTVNLQARTLSGRGTLRANGGAGAYTGTGGGRVAVKLTQNGANFSTFMGSMTAYGGSWNIRSGAAGTVYKQTSAQAAGQGTLIIDNGGAAPYLTGICTVMPPGVNLNDFAQIVLTNKGNLGVTTNDTLNFELDRLVFTGTNNSYVTLLSTTGVSFPNPYTLSNYTLVMNTPLAVTGDWTVAMNGVITHGDNPAANEPYKIDLTINGNLTINGTMDAIARGYRGGYGPGKPSHSYGGSSHGGLGSFGNGGTLANGGPTYGSILNPTNSGSGGGRTDIPNSAGGGAILLTVASNLAVNGSILASTIGVGDTVGSGGSVNIKAGTLSGAGPIKADGNTASYNASGGGRVAVRLTQTGATFGSYTGAMTAYGGNHGTVLFDGAPGTVYRQTPTNASLRIANFASPSTTSGVVAQLKGEQGLATTLLTISNTTLAITSNTTVRDVTLASNSTLDLGAKTLTVYSAEHTLDGTVVSNGGQIIWITPGLYVDDTGIPEGPSGTSTSAVFRIRIINVGSSVSFDYFTTNDSAEAGSDYIAAAGSVTIPEGVMETNLAFTITGDDGIEASETFRLVVTNVVGPPAQDAEGVCTITNDDARTLSITPSVTVNPEGNSGIDTTAVFTVTLSQAIGTAVTFRYDTVNGTAVAPGDYEAVSAGMGTITPGTTQTNFSFAIHGDNASEGISESFTVVLSDPSANATLGTATGTCVIADDDGLTLISLADRAVTEGDTGSSTAHFVVSISKSSLDEVSFNYRTADGTATVANGDYTAATGTASIPAGALQTTVDVAVAGDYWLEPNESFELQVYNLANADPLDTNSVCTIQNDDYIFVWTGAAGGGLASATNNWRWNGAPAIRLPGTGDIVRLDSTSSSNLIWNAPTSGLADGVLSWTQTESYSGAVTFLTRFPGQGPFTNFTIASDCVISNGSWTHATNPVGETATYRLYVTVGGNFLMTSNASVNTDGLGFRGGNGPGMAAAGSHGGASHGGLGASSDWGPSISTVYGSVDHPVTLGSGGSRSASPASAGGGAVILAVTGDAVVDGTLSANGAFSGDTSGGGGTVNLQARTLSGRGTLRANGATGAYSGTAGGRVAVKLMQNDADFSAFSGIMTAYGGNWNIKSGAAGTVYKQTGAQAAGQGTLIIDNGNLANYLTSICTIMPPGVNLNDFAQIIITNKGNLGITTNDTLDLSPGRLVCAGSDNSYVTLISGSGLSFPDSSSISNFTLVLNTPLTVTGDLTVAARGTVTHGDNPNSSDLFKVRLTVIGNLTVDGAMDASVRGYRGGYGPGKPNHNYGGASYGGMGGYGNGATFTNVGPTYGSILNPAHSGSGGGRLDGPSSAGGGVILLTVSSNLAVNGTIAANAIVSGDTVGSGGSVNITAGTLSGAGTIRADSASLYSGSGGGRVAVRLTQSGATFSGYVGTITARGGGVGGNGVAGAAGTIYREDASTAAGSGTVTVDNGNSATNLSYTSLPAFSNSTENIENTSWVTTNMARICLITNALIMQLNLNQNGSLELANYTLSLNSLIVTNKTYPRAIYGPHDTPISQLTDSGSNGKVVFDMRHRGTMFIIQ